MKQSDILALMDGIAPGIAASFAKAIAPVLARLDAAEKRVAELEADAAGKMSATDMTEALTAAVDKVLTQQPKPATSDEVATLAKRLDEMPTFATAKELAELAGAHNEVREVALGLPGEEAVAALIDKAVAAKVADLPPAPTAGEVATLIREAQTVADSAIAKAITEMTAAHEKSIAGINAIIVDEVRAEIDHGASVADAITAAATKAVGALPKAKDGESVTLEQLRPLVDEMVTAKVAEIPPAKDGQDVDLEAVRTLIADEVRVQVADLPPAQNGKDATPEAIKAAVETVLATWERPKDGKSVTAEEVLPVLQADLAKAVAALPPAKDGVGLAGMLIDVDGVLVGTLTDGSLHKLGPVRGEKGLDGLGFDSIEVVDQGLTFAIRFTKGDQVKEFVLAKPTLADCYRGIWKPGPFKKGEAVTWSGSLFIAQADTEAKPETSDDWRLAVKRGRDGKDGVALEPKPKTPVKL